MSLDAFQFPDQAGDVVERLRQRISRSGMAGRRPFVIAIYGRSGVGKSTIAKVLARELKASVVEGDDFFAGGVELRNDSPEGLAEACIDWQAIRRVLQEFKEGRTSQYHRFDWAKFDRSKEPHPTTLQSDAVLILEGVYSARPDLRDLIDVSILVTLAETERLRRLSLREGGISAWENQWLRAEDWYFANSVFTTEFDMLIRN